MTTFPPRQQSSTLHILAHTQEAHTGMQAHRAHSNPKTDTQKRAAGGSPATGLLGSRRLPGDNEPFDAGAATASSVALTHGRTHRLRKRSVAATCTCSTCGSEDMARRAAAAEAPPENPKAELSEPSWATATRNKKKTESRQAATSVRHEHIQMRWTRARLS